MRTGKHLLEETDYRESKTNLGQSFAVGDDITNFVFEMRQTELVFSSDLNVYFNINLDWADAFNPSNQEAEAGRSL